MKTAPFVRAKDSDHEDVAFVKADTWWSVIAGVIGSLAIFSLLVVAILCLAKVPDSVWPWLVLTLWGV